MKKVSKEEALAAVRTLLEWIGEDPNREGLIETPDRVIKSYEEFFSGYKQNPKEVLDKTFKEIDGYKEMVLLEAIEFSSHCEHHMVPFIGKAHIAYIPDGKVVGISKIARLVDVYAKRLQVQERMTTQIAESIYSILAPKGVAVLVEAKHQCMTMRGANKKSANMITSEFLGAFANNQQLKQEFLNSLSRGK
jgi:GTP cyclohydrolase I